MTWQPRMRADRRTILSLLRNPSQLASLPDNLRDVAVRQLRRMRLLAHVAHELQRRNEFESLAPRIRDQLSSASTMARARARLASWELDRLALVLRPRDEFPVIVLKGCAYAMLSVPHAPGRILTDVDILVPEDRLEEAEALMLENGWESMPLSKYDDRYYREWSHEIPPLQHWEREMEVDVHHNILQRTARLKPASASLIQAARRTGSQGYAVLCPADMVLHAMVHLFHGSEMDDALREIVDIDALLRHFAAREADFWSKLAERTRLLGLQRPAWYALRYCGQWLHTPVPDSMLRAIESATPPALFTALMDRAVPAALFARHPDRKERGAAMARSLLLARTQWIRMPPPILAQHLLRKAWYRISQRPAARS